MRLPTLALLGLLLAAPPALGHAPPGLPPSAEAARPRTLGGLRIDEVQAAMVKLKLDGWLLWDERGRDPLAIDLLRPTTRPSRRWFYFLPAKGEPTLLTSRWDTAAFDGAVGKRLMFVSWRDLDTHLKALLRGARRVAMNHAPRAAYSTTGRIDGGTLELVRAHGPTVVSSGALLTQLRGPWTEMQRATHLLAAQRLGMLKDQAFRMIGDRIAVGQRVTEYDVQQMLLGSMTGLGVETEMMPVVAAGVNTADPLYVPRAQRSAEIRAGDLVILHLAVRQATVSDSVYAEMAWTGFVGPVVPDKYRQAWTAVRDARDLAQGLIQERLEKGKPLAAFEPDAAARTGLEMAGFGEKAPLPLGQALGRRVVGDGPFIDDIDMHDDRPLLPRMGVALLPSVHEAGQYGVRTGVDLYLTAKGVEVTVPPQAAIEAIRPTTTPPPAKAAPTTTPISSAPSTTPIGAAPTTTPAPTTPAAPPK